MFKKLIRRYRATTTIIIKNPSEGVKAFLFINYFKGKKILDGYKIKEVEINNEGHLKAVVFCKHKDAQRYLFAKTCNQASILNNQLISELYLDWPNGLALRRSPITLVLINNKAEDYQAEITCCTDNFRLDVDKINQSTHHIDNLYTNK